jgi:hypothetical protein
MSGPATRAGQRPLAMDERVCVPRHGAEEGHAMALPLRKRSRQAKDGTAHLAKILTDAPVAARVTSMSVGLTRLDTRSPWTLPPVHKDLDHILGFGGSEPLAQKLKQLRSISSHDHEQSSHRRAFLIQRHRCLRGLDGERLEGETRLG